MWFQESYRATCGEYQQKLDYRIEHSFGEENDERGFVIEYDAY